MASLRIGDYSVHESIRRIAGRELCAIDQRTIRRAHFGKLLYDGPGSGQARHVAATGIFLGVTVDAVTRNHAVIVIAKRGHYYGRVLASVGTSVEIPMLCRLSIICLHRGFADKIRLRNSDGSLDVDAWVVAVQCHDGKVAVAARFAKDVINWIVKS